MLQHSTAPSNLSHLNSYKEILLEKIEVNDKTQQAIQLFNQHFNRNDVFISFQDGRIRIFLNQISFSQAEEIIPKIYREVEDAFIYLVFDAIKNIKSYGLKAGKRAYVNYNRERKVQNRNEKIKKRTPHYYANHHGFSKINHRLPEEYLDQIVCADSLTWLKKLPDNCIDLIFTSPPYNFGLDYSNDEQDDRHWQQYFDTLFAIFSECVRVLKFSGRFIVNIQPLFSDYIPSHHMVSNYLTSQEKLIWKGEVLWEKNNYNCKYSAWGSWKSPSSPYLKSTWEFLEIFCKGSLKKDGNPKNIDIQVDEFKAWVVSKWSIAPARDMKKYGHPAMFPEKLVERVLKLFSYQEDIVLDPFNGVGTTTLVAKNLRRHYLGIDVSSKYCDIALERIKKKAS